MSDEAIETDLEPCPLCESTNVQIWVGTHHFRDATVTCDDCGCQTGTFDGSGTTPESNRAAAIEAWNRRPAQARIERLEAALRPFAELAAHYDGVPPPEYFGDTDFETRYWAHTKVAVTVGTLRAARAALKDDPA